jgi:hypothetical protein
MTHFILLPDKERRIKIDPGKGPNPSEEIPDLLHPFEHDVNTSEGGEFLDDALRMKDQPLGETNTNENE